MGSLNQKFIINFMFNKPLKNEARKEEWSSDRGGGVSYLESRSADERCGDFAYAVFFFFLIIQTINTNNGY